MQASSSSEVTRFMGNISADAGLLQQFTGLQDNGQILRMAEHLGFRFSEADYERYLDGILSGLEPVSGSTRMSGVTQCPSSWPTGRR